MDKGVYVLGVGANTAVLIDLAESCGYTVLGLYHYEYSLVGEERYGFKIIGCTEELLKSDSLASKKFVLSMGDIEIRTKLYNRIKSLGGEIPKLIHPTCVVSRFARISEGVCISAFTNIQADVLIKENCTILSGVNISHSNTIGRNCFIAGGCTIGAYTTLEDNVFVGLCSTTISNKVKLIGESSFIGAGSLVTKDVEPFSRIVGRPAKPI